MNDLYFDNRKLPRTQREYVAFIDIMGTQNHMRRSVRDTSNFIFKLHAAIVSAWRKSAYQGVFVYPIMDGVYITSKNKENMEKILVKIFSDISEVFLRESNLLHQFIPRCGLAYGEVIHGHDVPYKASKVFELDLGYKNNILLGQAMINAYSSENQAAPFGIYVHESAINQSSLGKAYGAFSRDWVWYRSTLIKVSDILPQQLGTALEQYYQVIMEEQHPVHYPSDRIIVHENMMKKYFDLDNGETNNGENR